MSLVGSGGEELVALAVSLDLGQGRSSSTSTSTRKSTSPFNIKNKANTKLKGRWCKRRPCFRRSRSTHQGAAMARVDLVARVDT